MALSEQERGIVAEALSIINHVTTSEYEAAAAFNTVRRIMLRHRMTLGQIAATDAGAVEAMRQERDRHKRAAERMQRAAERAAEKAQRQMAERMEAANSARSAEAEEHARMVGKVISAIRREHRGISMDGIAAELTRRGVRTAWGNTNWTRMQVHRILRRL